MSDIVERLRSILGLYCQPPAPYKSQDILDMMQEAADEIERLRALLRDSMCPGGGYTGQPANEDATVENCLKAGVCGCDMGAALTGRKE